MEKIEETENPILGKMYSVRHILRNNVWWPVFSNRHIDDRDHELNPHAHYHCDWRFVPDKQINMQREQFSKPGYEFLLEKYNKEYYAAFPADEILKEEYRDAIYLRDFEEVPEFSKLKRDMFLKNIKMKNKKCPHHGTNLKSCRISINGNVQCPQHGLIWNVDTGNLII